MGALVIFWLEMLWPIKALISVNLLNFNYSLGGTYSSRNSANAFSQDKPHCACIFFLISSTCSSCGCMWVTYYKQIFPEDVKWMGRKGWNRPCCVFDAMMVTWEGRLRERASQHGVSHILISYNSFGSF